MASLVGWDFSIMMIDKVNRMMGLFVSRYGRLRLRMFLSMVGGFRMLSRGGGGMLGLEY